MASSKELRVSESSNPEDLASQVNRELSKISVSSITLKSRPPKNADDKDLTSMPTTSTVSAQLSGWLVGEQKISTVASGSVGDALWTQSINPQRDTNSGYHQLDGARFSHTITGTYSIDETVGSQLLKINIQAPYYIGYNGWEFEENHTWAWPFHHTVGTSLGDTGTYNQVPASNLFHPQFNGDLFPDQGIRFYHIEYKNIDFDIKLITTRLV